MIILEEVHLQSAVYTRWVQNGHLNRPLWRQHGYPSPAQNRRIRYHPKLMDANINKRSKHGHLHIKCRKTNSSITSLMRIVVRLIKVGRRISVQRQASVPNYIEEIEAQATSLHCLSYTNNVDRKFRIQILAARIKNIDLLKHLIQF